MRTRSLAVVFVLATVSTGFLAGCSGKPENSPAIRKKFADFDKTQKNVDELSATVASLSDEVKRLSSENSELRLHVPELEAQNKLSKATSKDAEVLATADKPATDSAIPAIEGADKPLEEATLAGTPPAEVKTPEAAAPVAPKSSTAKDATKPATKDAKPATEKRALASNFKDKTGPAVKTAPAKMEVLQTKGTFYSLTAGETADTVATKYGISKDELMKANFMPAGARLAAGQKLFIPGK